MIEYILPSGPEPAIGHILDVLMMASLGGRERTREEHQALIEPAGYAFAGQVPIPVGSSGKYPPWTVLEFRRG